MTSSSTGARTDLATRGEALAARHLTGRGMEVLDRNWRCDLGEIDLVLRDGSDLVVCEVKTRGGVGFGDPLEAITREKLARLRRLAGAYAARDAGWVRAVRVDAVGILWAPGDAPVLRHVRNVVP